MKRPLRPHRTARPYSGAARPGTVVAHPAAAAAGPGAERAFPNGEADASGRIAADVPYGIRIASAWAWRLGIILALSAALVFILSKIGLLAISLLVAALLAALLYPVTRWLTNLRFPTGLAVTVTLITFLGVVFGALALVGRQLVIGFSGLWHEALLGLQQVQGWLANGPLQLSNAQMEQYLKDAQNALQQHQSEIVSGALSFGSTATQFAAGFLLTIFTLVFFLAEGQRIWMFVVGLLPKRARTATNGAGRRAWTTLGHYVRIQVLVALLDAIGIGAGAAIISVPLALPLAVLVFLGAFIPIVGAFVTGLVAVLLALVANGWFNALIMLGIVVLVQQAESHLLQPLVMGRAVHLHPLAVAVVVTGGTLLGGIIGALFAVPSLAAVNSFVRYIAAREWESDPALGAPPGPPEPRAGPDTKETKNAREAKKNVTADESIEDKTVKEKNK